MQLNKMKSILAAVTLFLLTSISQSSDGFVSFYIGSGDSMNIVTQSGNISNVTRTHVGAFEITMNDEGTTDYQVTVSNDSFAIAPQTKVRTSTSFHLILVGLFPGDTPNMALADPGDLCTVTIDRLPPE